MWWESVDLRRQCYYFYLNHSIICIFLFILCPRAWVWSICRVCIRQFVTSMSNRFIKNHTYIWLGKTMDILASSIISTHDVDKTQNSILKVPWFHTPASHFSRNRNDTMGKIAERKLPMVDSFWIFSGSFFAHFSSDILTKHNITETSSKGNIWGPLNIPKGEGSGGG